MPCRQLTPCWQLVDTPVCGALAGRLLPPETGLPRLAGDTRSKTFLHDELRSAVLEGSVEYLLQVQLYPVSGMS